MGKNITKYLIDLIQLLANEKQFVCSLYNNDEYSIIREM